jgi:hypothetical protein
MFFLWSIKELIRQPNAASTWPPRNASSVSARGFDIVGEVLAQSWHEQGLVHVKPEDFAIGRR